MSTPPPLSQTLSDFTAPATLVEPGPEGYLRCTACAHRCVMNEGRAGACGVRFVRDATLQAPWGYVARHYVRSVEINTIYHVRPGALSLTYGMYGCDLRCPYCHNWKLSQALRDGVAGENPIPITPRAIVDEAVQNHCEVLCAAYNEPMISAEWNHAIFTEAKSRGLATALISDGNTTPEALDFMRPVTDVYRIDLKGYTSEHYKGVGGRLEPVLEAIGLARSRGYWVELVTLVVPGFNDDLSGLRSLASRIASVDRNIPWHLNAFVPRYKLLDRRSTEPELLMTAVGTAYARGLRFVYASNLPARLRELGHTRCPDCHTVLVEREDYRTLAVHLDNGHCPNCRLEIPGLWGNEGNRATPGTTATRCNEDGAEKP